MLALSGCGIQGLPGSRGAVFCATDRKVGVVLVYAPHYTPVLRLKGRPGVIFIGLALARGFSCWSELVA